MSALEAYGNFVLEIGDSLTTPTWTPIAHIVSYDGPNTELSFNDSTDFSSLGRYREFTPGLKDPGTMDLTLHLHPNDGSYETLEAAHDAEPPELLPMRLKLLTGSDQKKRTFSAYVANIRERGQVDGFLEATVSLRVSGPIDRDAA
jgi:hypothetical protein